jgi:hypothetical protein
VLGELLRHLLLLLLMMRVWRGTAAVRRDGGEAATTRLQLRLLRLLLMLLLLHVSVLGHEHLSAANRHARACHAQGTELRL